VLVTNPIPAGQVQRHFFDAAERDTAARASEAMDALNAKYGRGTVRFAVQGEGHRFPATQTGTAFAALHHAVAGFAEDGIGVMRACNHRTIPNGFLRTMG
jgi:hypothetical protein